MLGLAEELEVRGGDVLHVLGVRVRVRVRVVVGVGRGAAGGRGGWWRVLMGGCVLVRW